jgi:glycine hydroxymethyltransferase
VFRRNQIATTSHQLAIEAGRFGGGQAAARRLRRANLLTCGIGLPIAEVPGDVNGLRLGTPEVARLGMTATDMRTLAGFIQRAFSGDPEAISADVTAWRSQFRQVHFTLDSL